MRLGLILPGAVRERVGFWAGRGFWAGAVLLAVTGSLCATFPSSALAQPMKSYLNFEQVFGYKSSEPSKSFHVQFVASNAPGLVFWPNDEANFEFQVINLTDQPLKASGRWEIVQYATRCLPMDPFAPPIVTKLKDAGQAPVSVDVAAKGFADFKVKLPIPAEFGTYAVVLALDGHGREIAANCVRTVAAAPGRQQYPTYACDIHRAEMSPLFQRIGVKGTRIEMGYFDPKDTAQWDRLDSSLKLYQQHEIAVMVTVATGGDYSKMPLGHIRGFLNDKAEGRMDYPGDFTMLPQYDEAFQDWVRQLAERYGWPKGPVNAIELWNEPWEGISISGWGADMPRYRELYTRMSEGVEQARKNANVQVLIGGACSSMNTEDKLFPDGKADPFLKWLDFTSIHYQPMCPQPVLIKTLADRKNPHGPTRVWDTESWIANSEDRVAGVIASMRATGLERCAGVLHDAVRQELDVDVRQADGTTRRVYTLQPLATACAIGAMNRYLGARPFREILFKNGLPWVFVFDGLENAEDGTVVVLGDLGAVYERRLLLFRNVLGFEARKRGQAARAKLAALPPDATEATRNAALNEIAQAETLDQASLTVADNGHVVPVDCYGNPLKPQDGKIVVPLNGLGYYLRSDGSPGSFAKLIEALRTARVEGYEPLDVVAHDLLARIDSKPTLRLELTNVLNRPVRGKLEVKLGELQLKDAAQALELGPHETKQLELPISGGAATANNSYPLTVSFDAGPDGRKTHAEDLHVNAVAHKSIQVDGNLDDWNDTLPQPIRSTPGAGKNLTEKAWLPFVKFEDAAGQGYASGYLAYDDQNFYFAAKIADSSPYDGNIRFAQRDDDSYYYPETAWDVRVENGKEQRTEFHWPAGVRRYSYRKNPDLPTGDGSDNVQIGFNVLPIEETDWLAYPKGTMPRFTVYKTTDYEYALNTVAEKHGGGGEIWRLIAPGVPRKHYYPRQPKAERDGGPVTGGKLVTRRDGNTRLVECAIPWSELPHVRQALDRGQPVKFTYRVNDNKGPSYELNEERSVSKADTYALHNYWQTSWAVETEFAFEK